MHDEDFFLIESSSALNQHFTLVEQHHSCAHLGVENPQEVVQLQRDSKIYQFCAIPQGKFMGFSFSLKLL